MTINKNVKSWLVINVNLSAIPSLEDPGKETITHLIDHKYLINPFENKGQSGHNKPNGNDLPTVC
jgi:hypothetical protein